MKTDVGEGRGIPGKTGTGINRGQSNSSALLRGVYVLIVIVSVAALEGEKQKY